MGENDIPEDELVIPDPQAYDHPGDTPTSEISQEKVDFGKEPDDGQR